VTFKLARTYIYAFSRFDPALKKGHWNGRWRIAVDIIFIVCSVGGFAAVLLITLTLLLIAMGRIEV
jgi:choline-glycine betaine transporter